ncbi:hypothetical protein [Mucilaginibacter lacusdianchii]|uniref:hypothetical protein n=1 Tax=Mucilaginibacter lacusdianchii TaxID=2684211 RepID=UPI00131E2E33|nr:hypothetical protein [Mucilaginibacter sp. JXJ CY 39]
MLLILLIGELRSYSRYYIAAKRRTPALSISAKYIFDHQSERKFYWNNIKSYELYSGLNRTVIYIDLKESSTRQDNTLAIPFISKLWLTLYNNTTNKFSISLLEDGNTIMQQLQAYEPEGQIMAQNL